MNLELSFTIGAGVHVADGIIPGVPLGCERQPLVNWLLEGELSAGAVGCGDNVSRKVVSAKRNARAVFPLLGERCVDIISRVVGPHADGKKQVIPDEKGPSRGLGFPKPPLHRRRDFEFVHSRRAEPVEIHSDFDSVPDANDDARREGGEEIHWAQSAVQFTVDLSFVQDVRTGNVEYGFLPVGAADWENEQKKQPKSGWPDVSTWEQER